MKKFLVLGLCIAIVFMSFGGLNVAAEDQIVVFEDAVFENYIREKISKPTGDILASDVCNILDISVYNMGITSLKGIEYMPSLADLRCSGNALTSLDVSGLSQLRILACSNNEITELVLDGCDSLWDFSCLNNKLTDLDVSGLKSVVNIGAGGNMLSEIDISDLPQLQSLYISDTLITSLDISNNPNLVWLEAMRLSLTNIDELLERVNLNMQYSDDVYSYFRSVSEDRTVELKTKGLDDIYLSYNGIDHIKYVSSSLQPIGFINMLDAQGRVVEEIYEDYFTDYGGYFIIPKTGDVYVEFILKKEGDLNGDEEANLADIVVLRNCVMKKVSASASTVRRADLDANGEVNISDIVTLRNIIMNG